MRARESDIERSRTLRARARERARDREREREREKGRDKELRACRCLPCARYDLDEFKGETKLR